MQHINLEHFFLSRTTGSIKDLGVAHLITLLPMNFVVNGFSSFPDHSDSFLAPDLAAGSECEQLCSLDYNSDDQNRKCATDLSAAHTWSKSGSSPLN